MAGVVFGVIGGFGLFVVGMHLLTENLKAIASRRLRRVASRWTSKPSAALFLGAFAGSITQSMLALNFIVVGLLRSGMTDIRSALMLVLGGFIGSSILVFIVILDARDIALCVLGVAGVMLVSERSVSYRPLAGGLFGAAMVVFGLIVLKDAVAPLANEPWFSESISNTRHSLELAFLVAILLTALVQSAIAVVILGIAMASVSVISVDQAIIILYGCCIGSSAILYLFSLRLEGLSRQITMYTLLFNVWICAPLVPLFYIELYTDIPLVKALILEFNADLDLKLGAFFVLITIIPIPFLLVTLRPSIAILERFWPTSSLDDLASPKFINDHPAIDVDTSLLLVNLEQKQWLRSVSQYFDAAREGTNLATVREAARTVLVEIDEFLKELQSVKPMYAIEERIVAMNRQKLLVWLEQVVGTLCAAIADQSDNSSLDKFKMSMCESVDAVLLTLIDALEVDDANSWWIARQLMGDRSEILRKIRASYLQSGIPMANDDVFRVMLITNAVEEVFFVLSKIEAEYNTHA